MRTDTFVRITGPAIVPSQNEKAFLDFNRSIAGITDFADLPLVLEDTIKHLMPIDRLGFYTASHQCATSNITNNPHLTFNWDELCQEIAPYGTYRELDAQGRAEILYRALWLKKNGIPQPDGM
jgi:hypothetical protein